MFTVQVLTHDTVLNPLQQRAAFRQLGYTTVPQPETEIPADDCLRLWLIMMLGELKFLAPEQRTIIFDSVTKSLEGTGEALWNSMQRQASATITPMVVVGDGQYITWSGHIGWLDLVSGDVISEPQVPVLETVGYNLAVLFGRNALACQQLQRKMDHAPDCPAD